MLSAEMCCYLTREVSSDWGLLRHFLSLILTITLFSPLLVVITLELSSVSSSSSLKPSPPLSTSSPSVLMMFIVDRCRPNLNREL